ncbi:MAG: hypothetical protein PHV62_08820, partial [Sulfuricurvum sp.]|nr:hypothetical protein [Sulfuricurvum sp.]
EGYTGETFFILHYQGKNIEVVLRRVSEKSSVKLADNPFRVVWKLERINKDDLKGFEYQEILKLLKEILYTYGWQGMGHKEVPQKNLLVELRA